MAGHEEVWMRSRPRVDDEREVAALVGISNLSLNSQTMTQKQAEVQTCVPFQVEPSNWIPIGPFHPPRPRTRPKPPRPAPDTRPNHTSESIPNIGISSSSKEGTKKFGTNVPPAHSPDLRVQKVDPQPPLLPPPPHLRRQALPRLLQPNLRKLDEAEFTEGREFEEGYDGGEEGDRNGAEGNAAEGRSGREAPEGGGQSGGVGEEVLLDRDLGEGERFETPAEGEVERRWLGLGFEGEVAEVRGDEAEGGGEEADEG